MIYAVALSIILFLQSIPKKQYFLIIGSILTMIIGLRSVDIGIDTYQYELMFKSIINYDLQSVLSSRVSSELYSNILGFQIEIGYIIFNYIVSFVFGDNFQMVLLIIAALYVFSISMVIYKYSDNPWLSFFLFVTFGYFTFAMSGLRQTMAMTFTVLSVLFLLRGRNLLFLLFVGIAATFHISAVIFLPTLLFSKIKINKTSLIIFFLLAVITYVYTVTVFGFLNLNARLQYVTLETGGMRMYLFLLFSLLIGLFFKNKDDSRNDLYFFMIIATITLWPVAKMNPALFRITFPFSIFIVIFVPNMLKTIKNEQLRLVCTTGFVVVAVYNFVTGFLLRPELQLMPYRFFFE